MGTEIDSEVIARYLVEIWKATLPDVADYLRRQFGYSLDPAHQFKRLFICEMADAEVSDGNIGGRFARKWVFVNGALEEVALNFAAKEMHEKDESEVVYISPSYFFGLGLPFVLLSERYGPSLLHRRLGLILSGQPSLRIEWETLWCARP